MLEIFKIHSIIAQKRGKMVRRKDSTYWNVPVPKPLNDALEKILLRNAHATKAAFIRDAVRKELRKYGVTERDFLSRR